MKNLSNIGAIILIIIIVLMVLCLVPMVTLWAVNTLAVLSGVSFYIPHTVKSYFCVLILVSVFNGSSDKFRSSK